jgi:hypothetical protein
MEASVCGRLVCRCVTVALLNQRDSLPGGSVIQGEGVHVYSVNRWSIQMVSCYRVGTGRSLWVWERLRYLHVCSRVVVWSGGP